MRTILLMLATSMCLALGANAHTQAPPPTDRKVHFAPELLAPVAIPQVTAEMPVVTAHQLVNVATTAQVVETSAVTGVGLPSTAVANDVFAPPSSGVGASARHFNRRRRNLYADEKQQPTRTILHPDPGRQR